MKNALIKAAQLLLINTGILIGSTMVLYLFSIAVLVTVFNAIFGDSERGMYALNAFIRICYPIISALIICIPHGRSTTVRREYLNSIGTEFYDRKADMKNVLKNKIFYAECAVFVLVYVVAFFISNPPAWIFMVASLIFPFSLWQDVSVLFVANPPQWIFLLAILVFPFFNLWHHTKVHRQWASERIRMG